MAAAASPPTANFFRWTPRLASRNPAAPPFPRLLLLPHPRVLLAGGITSSGKRAGRRRRDFVELQGRQETDGRREAGRSLSGSPGPHNPQPGLRNPRRGRQGGWSSAQEGAGLPARRTLCRPSPRQRGLPHAEASPESKRARNALSPGPPNPPSPAGGQESCAAATPRPVTRGGRGVGEGWLNDQAHALERVRRECRTCSQLHKSGSLFPDLQEGSRTAECPISATGSIFLPLHSVPEFITTFRHS